MKIVHHWRKTYKLGNCLLSNYTTRSVCNEAGHCTSRVDVSRHILRILAPLWCQYWILRRGLSARNFFSATRLLACHFYEKASSSLLDWSSSPKIFSPKEEVNWSRIIFFFIKIIGFRDPRYVSNPSISCTYDEIRWI